MPKKSKGEIMSFKKGIIPWNKGLTNETDERVKRISEKNSITRKRLYKEGKLKSYLPDYRLLPKESQPHFGKRHSEETKRKISESHKGKHLSPKTEFKKGNMSGYRYTSKMSKEIRAKYKEEHKVQMREHWRNEEYRERTIKAQLKGLFKRPTSL